MCKDLEDNLAGVGEIYESEMHEGPEKEVMEESEEMHPATDSSDNDPLVDELQELWHGMILEDSSFLGHQVYRAALLCLSSDIPATRKCGGFVRHGAYRGCHKCLKTFRKKEFVEKMDYSGFEWSSWEPRTSKDHIHYAGLSKRARTKAEQKRIERKYGARWSELFRLSYYDAIRFVVINPMHNLLLESALLAAAYAELLVFVGHASGRLRLPRGRVKKGAARRRLDERFLSVHKLCSSHKLFHSFLIYMFEIGKAWKNP
ncbi:hypothetical protein DPX16_22309 [Anabarilius grahami]|uniref:Uncharacterized protein n=1 Tax=Anabarilius grahami TaxID=495550 RepID=A0A3N0YVH4_ANAGA|nr:hypothetical protein DPX16_22309 [Anabarilius grahami]